MSFKRRQPISITVIIAPRVGARRTASSQPTLCTSQKIATTGAGDPYQTRSACLFEAADLTQSGMRIRANAIDDARHDGQEHRPLYGLRHLPDQTGCGRQHSEAAAMS